MTMLWNDGGLSPMPIPPTPVETGADFMAELSAVSRQLCLTRLRCSLFAIRARGIDFPVALQRLKARFERLGVVGALDNGSIGFLHLDRCLVPERSDAAVADSIRQQAVGALKPGNVKRFVALHYWTDEVSVVDDLVRRLEDRAFRRAYLVRPDLAIATAAI